MKEKAKESATPSPSKDMMALGGPEQLGRAFTEGDTCLRFTHLGADFLESQVLIDYFVDVVMASKHKEIPILGERPSEAKDPREYAATAFSIWNRRDRNKTRGECRARWNLHKANDAISESLRDGVSVWHKASPSDSPQPKANNPTTLLDKFKKCRLILAG
ncbi:hypothetical protein FCOIX_7370 [Fusarium coicis]|nr:hypothetical protein FCOIX_7370 [Fusarium coicis]